MPKNIFNGGFVTSDGEAPSAARWNSLGIFGDGSDGSYTSGNNLTPGKVYNFTDFVLNSGDTLSSTASNSGEPIIIKVQGDVDISGSIALKGQGFTSNNGLTTQSVGGRGSQVVPGIGSSGQAAYKELVDGGFENSAGGHGGTEFPEEIFMKGVTQPLAASGSGGGNGNIINDGNGDEEAAGGGGGASYGANGGGGQSNQGVSNFNEGSGGDGGGSIVFIVAGDLSFTGEIDIRGNSGGGGNAGGGGGGGGMFYGLYTGALTDTGTKQVVGGSGGSADANGGDGANGTILFEPVS